MEKGDCNKGGKGRIPKLSHEMTEHFFTLISSIKSQHGLPQHRQNTTLCFLFRPPAKRFTYFTSFPPDGAPTKQVLALLFNSGREGDVIRLESQLTSGRAGNLIQALRTPQQTP